MFSSFSKNYALGMLLEKLPVLARFIGSNVPEFERKRPLP